MQVIPFLLTVLNINIRKRSLIKPSLKKLEKEEQIELIFRDENIVLILKVA